MVSGRFQPGSGDSILALSTTGLGQGGQNITFSCEAAAAALYALRDFRVELAVWEVPDGVDFRSAFGELGPESHLDRRGSSFSARCTKNQPRRPVLRPFRGHDLVSPDSRLNEEVFDTGPPQVGAGSLEFLLVLAVFGPFPLAPGRLSYPPGALWSLCFCGGAPVDRILPAHPTVHRNSLKGRYRCVRNNCRARPFEFTSFEATYVTQPHKLIWFGDIHGPKPY